MATVQTNEQRLDQAETLLKQVLKDTFKNRDKYRAEDLRALEDAVIAVNKVTLLQD